MENSESKQVHIINDSDYKVKSKSKIFVGFNLDADESNFKINNSLNRTDIEEEPYERKESTSTIQSERDDDLDKNHKITMAPLPTDSYKQARNALLNNLVPMEEDVKTSCLFRTCCCFYYACCCCLCCEKSKAVTKQTFVSRFEKWLHLDSREKAVNVCKAMIRLYAH